MSMIAFLKRAYLGLKRLLNRAHALLSDKRKLGEYGRHTATRIVPSEQRPTADHADEVAPRILVAGFAWLLHRLGVPTEPAESSARLTVAAMESWSGSAVAPSLPAA
jgi:hypothetical protein